MRTPTIHCAWPLGAELGEGPVWSGTEQSLRFVDIKAGRVHCFDPATGVGSTIETGGMPSFIVPIEGGGWLVGSGNGLCPLTPTGLADPIISIDQPAHNRTNDATVDNTGRLWLGTMDDREEKETGTIWCLDRGVLRPTSARAVVTNGPACCAKNGYIYHVDSPRRRIWRCRLGPDASLAESSLFAQLGEEDGYPDGVVVDAEACLWIALWDGWGVRRYSPEGEMLMHVPLPCARVTKIAFGGPDLRTAYVTTARTGLNDRALHDQPLAGSLFAFDPGTAGTAMPAYRPGTRP